MRLKTSFGIANVACTSSTWRCEKGIHLLKLPESMSETSRTLQIFSRLTCATVESALERDVEDSEVPLWSKWPQGSIIRGRVW